MKRIALVIACLMLAGIASAQEYAGTVKTWVLFDGGTLDSTEHSSHWIPTKDAMRIVIRTWSTHGAFTGPGSGDVDSTTTDSIGTWKTDFSDSVAFIAVDSLGTVVTARSTIPRTIGVHGEPYPICADSIEFTNNVADTSISYLNFSHLPVNKPLRAPASGSGIYSYIFNVLPNTVATLCGDCTLVKGYMKVKITPVRRSTSQTVLATVPSRTNGLKGFRCTATVYYRHH